ncbi:MAG: hypothetical protein FWC50_04775 [Planctomycetaceae bacterium]|nr:hypothetical protein [Planctomycetaceae bacterium]
MKSHILLGTVFLCCGLLLTGCPQSSPQKTDTSKTPNAKAPDAKSVEAKPAEPKSNGSENAVPKDAGSSAAQKPAEKPALPKPTANEADVAAALKVLVEDFDGEGKFQKNDAGAVIAISARFKTPSDDKKEEYLQKIALLAKLTDLESIDFYGPITEESLLEFKPLTKLKKAVFENTLITDVVLEMLAENMPGLTFLNIRRSDQLNDDSLDIIAKMKNLKTLELLYNSFTGFGMGALEPLEQLEVLDLRGCMKIDNYGLECLEGLPKLKVLKLRCAITDAGIENLAKCPSLQSVDIQDSPEITDETCEHLVKIPQLRDVNFFRLGLTDAGLKKLEGSKIQRFMIRDNGKVTDEGIAVLKTLPELNRVSIYEQAHITDEGLATALADNQKITTLAICDLKLLTNDFGKTVASLKNLRNLELRISPVFDDTLLEQVATLPKLETLIIGDAAGFTDAGFAKLANIKTLKSVEIKGTATKITQEAADALKKAIPGVTVKFTLVGLHAD